MPAVTLNGTGGDNNFVLTVLSADSFSLNQDGVVTVRTDVTQLTINGAGGNDTVTIVNPTGGLLSPTGGITFNGGGQSGDTLFVLGGNANSGTYTAGATVDAGTITHNANETQQVTV